MKLRPFLAGITLSVVSTWAWAGGSAVIEAGTGTNAVRTAIEFGDGSMRMGTAMPGMEGYMVMTETGIYMVTWARMMAAYMSVDVGGYQGTMDTLLAHGDGILRMGSAYRLVSLDGSAPPAARFTLPAAPQQLPAWLP